MTIWSTDLRSVVNRVYILHSILFIVVCTNLLPQFVGKDSLKISPFIFMDGNDNVWIDLLTEPNQILPRSVSGDMRSFFNGAPSLSELLYKTEREGLKAVFPSVLSM